MESGRVAQVEWCCRFIPSASDPECPRVKKAHETDKLECAQAGRGRFVLGILAEDLGGEQ